MKVAALAVVSLVIGCAPPSSGSVESSRSRVKSEQEAEYDVYSHLLRGQAKDGIVFVHDSTVPPFQGRAVFCFEPDREPGSCLEPRAGTSADAWKDFALKNRKAWLLHPLFRKDLGVKLKRETKVPEATCSGPTVVYFSRVGFDPERTQAVVVVTYVTGKGPKPGCGFATGSHLVLEKTETGWKEFGTQTMWVT